MERGDLVLRRNVRTCDVKLAFLVWTVTSYRQPNQCYMLHQAAVDKAPFAVSITVFNPTHVFILFCDVPCAYKFLWTMLAREITLSTLSILTPRIRDSYS